MKFKKIISKGLIMGLLFNNGISSFAGVLSEDGRYETFNGNNITIDNILEEDKVDVEIEGNTLVNLHKKQKYYFLTSDNSEKYIKEEKDNYVKVEILEDLSGWFFFNLGELNLDLIKPNSVYTICFEKIINIDEIKLCYRDAQGNIGEQYFYDVKNNKVIINTRDFKKEDLSDDVILYGLTSCTQGKEIEVSNAMIFEGILEDEDIPKEYFEGMKSVGELEDNKLNIEAIGENIFDVEYFTEMIETHYDEGNYGYEVKDGKNAIWTINDHKILNGKNILNNNYKFKENTQYIIKGDIFLDENNSDTSNALRGQINYTDGTGNSILYSKQKGEWVSTSIISNKDKTVKNITFTYGSPSSKGWIDLDSLYIAEYNPDKTKFNYDYNIQNLEIDLKEPLRALPNGVKDKIIKKNGQWVIERNLEEVILDGSDDEEYRTIDDEFSDVKWFGFTLKNKQLGTGNSISNKFINSIAWDNIELLQDATNYNKWNCNTYISINKDKLLSIDIDGFKHWLKSNPVRIVYKLSEPTYEPLNINPTINLYSDITHISNNSTIPANMKVAINRTINRAIEAIELAKINPTVENISLARMWTNLLKETINKDELQSEINNITDIQDLQLEKKAVSANVDIYIKSENSLSMTLSTNSIMFEDYSGVSDIEKLNALEITVNSSLPYDLNAYLENEIQNSDKSTTMDSNLLQIKESKDLNYKTFNNTTDKVILEEDCTSGNYNKHNIDLKIEGSNAYKADVYKAVVKFEAEQK